MTKNERNKKSAKSAESAREKQQQIKGFLFHADFKKIKADIRRFLSKIRCALIFLKSA